MDGWDADQNGDVGFCLLFSSRGCLKFKGPKNILSLFAEIYWDICWKIYGCDHHLKWQFIVWHILIAAVMDYCALLCRQQKTPMSFSTINRTEASIWEVGWVCVSNERNNYNVSDSQTGGAAFTQRIKLKWKRFSFNITIHPNETILDFKHNFSFVQFFCVFESNNKSLCGKKTVIADWFPIKLIEQLSCCFVSPFLLDYSKLARHST